MRPGGCVKHDGQVQQAVQGERGTSPQAKKGAHMNYMDSGGILCEAQDERLKTLAKILLPGLALLLVPVLFSESKLLSVPGALELLVPGLGVLFVISAFCTRCRVTLTSDKRVLEVKHRLLGWDFDKMEFDLSHVSHVCLDWDDHPPFLAALVNTPRLRHPRRRSA